MRTLMLKERSVSRTVFLVLAVVSCCCWGKAVVASAGPGALLLQAEPDFPKAAGDALDREDWTGLEKLSRDRLKEEPTDPRARAFLALALAGERKFDAAVAELEALAEAGHAPDKEVRGVGVPLAKMVNIIYLSCWADFNADHNRKAWGAFFKAFPDSFYSLTPASRLLMAAILKKDDEARARMEQWFDRMLDRYKKDSLRVQQISRNYARGYLRADKSNDKVLALAAQAYTLARADAEKRFKGVKDLLERRERCDVATDGAYWDLALACFLSGKFDPPENPLAEREAEPGAVFEDVTGAFGLSGVRVWRVAAADYDRDGYPDLCFSGRLFRNRKGKKFIEVTQEAGLGRTGTGALFFDYDGDGFLDLLVTAAPHPFLYRNLGRKGRFAFRDVTPAAGLDKLKVESSPDGAAVFDLDGDGWLDFYLATYEKPFGVAHPDLLVRNNGDGTFTDVSEVAGIRTVPASIGRGVTCSDLDRDGDTEVYVSNYRLLPNFLWVNDGKGGFSERGKETGLRGVEQKKYFGHTIGSCFGDVDGDGDLDLFCANLAHPRFITQGFSNLSLLFINESGEGTFRFQEERRRRGIRFQETHSDPAFADFDNDGDPDLFITAVYKGAPSCFFQNDGKGFFQPITFRSRSVVFNAWGQAWFDLEGDGDLDHLVCSPEGVHLQRNRGTPGRWLAVRLEGKAPNRFGVGAWVRVETGEGKAQVREVRIGRGTQSQDPLVLHFGLGQGATPPVKVSVTWPTGFTDTVTSLRMNRVVTVRQRKNWKRKR